MLDTVGVVFRTYPGKHHELISIHKTYESAKKEAQRLQESNESLSQYYVADEWYIDL